VIEKYERVELSPFVAGSKIICLTSSEVDLKFEEARKWKGFCSSHQGINHIDFALNPSLK
jgi:hypothetical protein